MQDITEIIRHEFDVDHKIDDNTSLESLGGNVGRTLMALELERVFGIEISDSELRNLKSVDDVHLLVIEKTAKRGRLNRPSTSSSNSMPGYASAASAW